MPPRDWPYERGRDRVPLFSPACLVIASDRCCLMGLVRNPSLNVHEAVVVDPETT